MKAISTKYRGPTNSRGPRVYASDGNGNRASIPYPHELSEIAVHAAAAVALCQKMKWSGELIGGYTRDGCVFVFADSDRFEVTL